MLIKFKSTYKFHYILCFSNFECKYKKKITKKNYMKSKK